MELTFSSGTGSMSRKHIVLRDLYHGHCLGLRCDARLNHGTLACIALGDDAGEGSDDPGICNQRSFMRQSGDGALVAALRSLNALLAALTWASASRLWEWATSTSCSGTRPGSFLETF